MNSSPRHIAIVAPSGYASDREAYTRAVKHFIDLGHHVHDFSSANARFQRFAATDAERVAQLHAAANHPDVELVIAVRGGYGLSRLLPTIDFPLLAKSGKRFIGHSDFTALHMGLLTQQAVSYAGPMICDDFSRVDMSDFTHSYFWQAVSHDHFDVTVKTASNPVITCEGRLWGGNLAMLTHLLGTPWMPHIKQGILFVEDVNEHPYRIERMMLQLLHAGVLHEQQAIILGDFSAYKLTDYDNGYDFEAMLDYLRQVIQVPILTGLPFGHVRDKLTLPVGADCHLESTGEEFVLQLSV
jgi:muramoyltetrapeptide carboxypeptidase